MISKILSSSEILLFYDDNTHNWLLINVSVFTFIELCIYKIHNKCTYTEILLIRVPAIDLKMNLLCKVVTPKVCD